MRFFVFGLRGRTAPLLVALTLSCALLLSAAASAGAMVVPARTTRCSISKVWHSLGPSYVEKLSVSGTSCGTGEKTVKAYNACRLRSGGVKGHCRSAVDGFRCTEKRQSSPVQFIGVVSCTKPRASVDFTYSEDT